MVTTIKKFGTWGGVFGRRSKVVKAIAEDLRARIVGLDPDTVEVPRKGDKAVAFGIGEKKMSESYCYLMPQTDYVNLGFWWGAMLDDPNKLLEGKGKKLRHIKIADQDMARSAKVSQMIFLAISERREGLAKAKAEKSEKVLAKKRAAKKETA